MTLPGRVTLKIRGELRFFRQAKAKGVHHHCIGLTRSVKRDFFKLERKGC